MRIAYIGENSGTSLHRAKALVRLGHQVSVINPWEWARGSVWRSRWVQRTGALWFSPFIAKAVLPAVRKAEPELIIVNQGELLGPSVLKRLREFGVPIANYTNDDPFNGRDQRRFRLYLQAIPFYDLLALVREQNLDEAKALGARKVMRVWMSADEIEHAPREVGPEQRQRFRSEVAFIGTWMEDRGAFMAELIRLGVPLSIWGGHWHKAPEWALIKPYWRGAELVNQQDYAAAILGAKVCLGLLSKGNRDLHTRRSAEIPALGGLFCGERTSEHSSLYEEGKEAVFWADAQECAEVCHALLNDEQRRDRIALAGHQRAIQNGLFNEQVMASIVDEAMSSNAGR